MKAAYLYICTALAICLLSACTEGHRDFGDYIPSLKAHLLTLDNKTAYSLPATASKIQLAVAAKETSWAFIGSTDWLTINPQTGNSNATVTLQATENTSTRDARTCQVTFSSLEPDYKYEDIFSITQSAAHPFITPSQTQLTFTEAASQQTVTITSNCTWTVSASQEWIHVSVDTTDNKVVIKADENTTLWHRQATITFTGEGGATATIAVEQEVPSGITTDNASLTFEQDGGNYTLSIQSEVAWTASTPDAWLQVTPANGKAGSTALQIKALQNGSTKSRTGYVYLYIGSNLYLTIKVTQKGLYISVITHPVPNFTAQQSDQSIQVESNTSWEVLTKPEWLTISPLSGNGNASLTLRAEDNWSLKTRQGTLTLGQEGTDMRTSVSVSQEGRYIKDLVTTVSFPSAETSQNVNVETDAKWTAKARAEDASWLSVSPTSGTSKATLTITVKENEQADEREGIVKLTVGDSEYAVAVVQNGKFFTIDPQEYVIGSRGGNHIICIKTDDSWTAKTQTSWLSLSSTSGKGDINVTCTAADNPSLKSRADTTIFMPSVAQPVRVVTRQSGRYMTIDATVLRFYNTGGTSQSVMVNTDGTFSVTTTDSWLSVIVTDNSFSITATENTTGSRREGSVSIKMTDLKDGETLELNLPVIQQKQYERIELDDFGQEQQWDIINNDKVTIKVTGFGNDNNWD